MQQQTLTDSQKLEAALKDLNSQLISFEDQKVEPQKEGENKEIQINLSKQKEAYSSTKADDITMDKSHINITREDSNLIDVQMLDLDDMNELNSEIIS